MGEIFDLIMKAITQFGFPTVVAGWALWRLDKSWALGGGVQTRLEQIEEGIDRVEVSINKQAEIQQEMLLTIKILQTIISSASNGGGDKK